MVTNVSNSYGAIRSMLGFENGANRIEYVSPHIFKISIDLKVCLLK